MDKTGQVLVAALHGEGECLVQASQTTAYRIAVAEAFQLGDLLASTSSSLSKAEINAMLDYPFISIGAACLLSAAASNLNSTLECTAALSCEVFGGKGLLECFDAAYYEVGRPQRLVLLTLLYMFIDPLKNYIYTRTFHPFTQWTNECRIEFENVVRWLEAI